MKKDKVIVIYKNGTIKYKSQDKFLPKNKSKLKKIKLFMIPAENKFSRLYIPVKPSVLLYGKVFKVSYKISIIDIETDYWSMHDNDFNLDINVNTTNVIEFIHVLHQISKLYGFNVWNLIVKELIADDDYDIILMYNVPYLQIIIDGNEMSANANFKRKDMEKIMVNGMIGGTLEDLPMKKVMDLVHLFIFKCERSYNNIYSIDKDSWFNDTADKSIKRDSDYILMCVDDFDYYVLLSKLEFVIMDIGINGRGLRVQGIYYSIPIGEDNLRLEDEPRRVRYDILADYLDNFNLYEEFTFRINSIFELITLISVITEILNYYIFMIVEIFLSGSRDTEKISIIANMHSLLCIAPEYGYENTSIQDPIIFTLDEIYSKDYYKYIEELCLHKEVIL